MSFTSVFKIGLRVARTTPSHATKNRGRMSVSVPLVTFDPADEKQSSIQPARMTEKSNCPESDAVHLANFSQVTLDYLFF